MIIEIPHDSMTRSSRFAMRGKHIIVIVPAYNEEDSISAVVAGVLKNSQVRCCAVIDDGSTDQTALRAKNAGAVVVKRKQNGGTDAAVVSGLLFSLRQGAEIVITMDADGQHNPEHIPELIYEIVRGADYVIASRYSKSTPDSTSFQRIMGTKIISLLIWISLGKRVYDPTSGFRAMTKRAAEYLAHHSSNVFSEPEAVLEFITQGLVIKEISVEMNKRLYGSSSIGFFRAWYLMGYIIVRILTGRRSSSGKKRR